MPELPEVETIVRCLQPHLLGRQIKGIKALFRPLLRDTETSFLNRLKGRRVIGLRRRGKMILMDCSGGRTLIFHLKMTGRLWMCRPNLPYDKHTHFIISFRGIGRELRFRDVRKFGFVLGLRTPDVVRARELRGLGPEPLELDRASFYRLFAGRRGRLKSLLLNQKVIAGIGNIYADEILFEARLHPRTEASRLRRRELDRLGTAVPLILEKAIRFKGTSVRDYRDGNGLEGLFQNFLRVYGREAQPCPRCGAKIRRIRIAGRSSYFCPLCQRKARES